MSDLLPSDAPRPRLCHLRKWPDFNGYGFNLHAERGKAGQFIGTVDAKSPAVAANLHAGDRIIEVNGTNIGSENHQQVVQRIKAVPDETRLLVIDEEADNYFKEHKMVVRGDMDNVDIYETPITNPFTSPTTGNIIDDEIEQSDVDTQPSDVAAATYANLTARLCHLKMWPDFAGYGFNLHADRSTPGQYVGKVDDGSPAEAAGLRVNDRIVEVNGCSVDGKSHTDVVTNIKSMAGEVRLLVVDAATDEFCGNNGIKISSASLTNVHSIVCPDCRPTSVNGEHVSSASLGGDADDDHDDVDAEVEIESSQYPQHIGDDDEDDVSQQQQQHSAVMDNMSPTQPATTAGQSVNVGGASLNVGDLSVNVEGPSANSSAGRPVVVAGIEFASSAKEARERMKKKSDVKQASKLSLRDKYELLQKL